MTQQTASVTAEQIDTIVVEPMSGPADARAFKELNEEWIVELFTLEPADSVKLDNPEREIVAKGGHVLIARDGEDIVGCVALVAEGDGVFELSKMAVARNRRGRGLGRIILREAIDYARRQSATTLFLGSSTKLADAVHLYESIGFVHVPSDQIGPMPYERADVFMRYELR
ncbi:GNAT family N-acetyltransferase [Nocardia sp. CA2R105]|uniref:GNAT family N-acetyltransferase n=1 Tax=Nocardia coffeae TaxID=2873381 RepID=UPI001CA6EF35|nr:GNAT family N-acetyltransferase [Nocardia coffeae]MBY8860859.1 GNAT family N-acetyltransferase [Nocardia coffeae]